MESVKKFFKSVGSYFEFNKTTLSGAIDVLVVEKENKTLSSTGFHVRFGCFKVLRPKRKTIEIYINDKKTNFVMLIGSDGEGYFAETVFISGKPYKKKALRPQNEKLKLLELNKGSNKITYSTDNETVNARLFFYNYNAKLIISDIDGTITKSDVMGQILTTIGKDWTHDNIAKLFTDLQKQGYLLLYLTARPYSQYSVTRSYLERIQQNEYKMPDGPIIMSPDSIVDSAKREVVLRTPERLKSAVLIDIVNVFGKNPFCAGFGNRDNDAISYRMAGLPLEKIFIINTKGEIRNFNVEKCPNAITYKEINENLNFYF